MGCRTVPASAIMAQGTSWDTAGHQFSGSGPVPTLPRPAIIQGVIEVSMPLIPYPAVRTI